MRWIWCDEDVVVFVLLLQCDCYGVELLLPLWCWAAAAMLVLPCCCHVFIVQTLLKSCIYDLDFVEVLVSFCRDFIINFLELYKWILLKYCCRFVEISPVNHPIHPFNPVINGWMDSGGDGCWWWMDRVERVDAGDTPPAPNPIHLHL